MIESNFPKDLFHSVKRHLKESIAEEISLKKLEINSKGELIATIGGIHVISKLPRAYKRIERASFKINHEEITIQDD